MLDSTSPSILKIPIATAPTAPALITGRFLARNRLSPEARIAIALRLAGGEPVSEFTIAQACRLARVPRARVDRQLGRHRSVGDALARAFAKASTQERVAFVRAIGAEKIWSVLEQAI
jgi:hypothetical protein